MARLLGFPFRPVRVLRLGEVTVALVLAGAAIVSFGGVAQAAPPGSFGQSAPDGNLASVTGGPQASANAVATDGSGRIVAAGNVSSGASAIALARYNRDGSLDKTFGEGGKVATYVGRRQFVIVDAVAIDSSGRIVVAGTRETATSAFLVARYKPNGRLDPTFGNGGKVTTHIAGDFGHGLAVAIDPAGRIIVAGYACGSIYGGSTCFALARYEPNGSLDSTFGSGGTVTTAIGFEARAAAVAVDSQGRIIAAGSSGETATPPSSFALARYDPNGSLDPAFGTGGTVSTGFGPGCSAVANALANDSSGRIVLAGSRFCSGSGTDFALARYDANGSLDPTFGSGGTVATPGGAASALAIDSQGRIVAAGAGAQGNPSSFHLARYMPTGALDPTFGTGGEVMTDIDPHRNDLVAGLAIDSGGRIVAAGSTCTCFFTNVPFFSDFALARYTPTGALDATFGKGGKVTTGFPPNTAIAKAKIEAKRHKARFEFRAIGGSTGFQCRLRSKKHKSPKFEPCRSPKTYKKLQAGKYTFEVRALGRAGPDLSPAKRRFRIR